MEYYITGSRTSQYKKLGRRKERAVCNRVLLLLFLKGKDRAEAAPFLYRRKVRLNVHFWYYEKEEG